MVYLDRALSKFPIRMNEWKEGRMKKQVAGGTDLSCVVVPGTQESCALPMAIC